MSERQVLPMENKKEEKMIYIKDLIFAALRCWRIVLVIALIGAILLGGLQAVSGLSGAGRPADPAAQQAAQQHEAEKAALKQRVALAQQAVSDQREYLQNSVKMQLNPHGYYEAKLVLHAETDYQIMPGMSYQNPNKVADILRAYKTVLQSEAAMTAMAEALQTENRYVFELLFVEIAEGAGMLSLSVKLPALEMAQTLLPVMESQTMDAYQRVKELSEHEMSVVDLSVTPGVDAALAETQKKEQTRLTELEKDLAEAEAARDGLADLATATVSVKAVVKKAGIFAVLGAAIGVFLTVCVIWMMHICTDRVYSVRTLQDRTGIKVLGCVSKGSVKGVDLWLQRLEGRCTQTAEAQAALLAADISIRTKGADRLLFTGSACREDRQELVARISEAMPGVQVCDCGNILTEAEARSVLDSCDAVVLVEACAASHYTAVREEIGIVNDYGKPVTGCVLMER